MRRLTPVSWKNVRIEGPFWGPRQEVNRAVTLPIEYEQLKKTGRLDAWKLEWKPGQPNPPHHFWDSDVAKWIEAAAYSLATHPDEQLSRRVDEVIDWIAAAQQEDGYLNIHFTVVEPENRWKNLRDMHELYCAGHLIEAAVAYYEATGKRKLLDVLCRYADHIATVFGPGPGQKRGYPGHEEIELALVKLYRVTGKKRYLDLAKFFIDERGRLPHYFDLEARERGEDPKAFDLGKYDYNQSHLPVREQTTAEGHAVRAMYLYSGMADVAAETGDRELFRACERLWENVTERRMYITGGVGSSANGERFTYDYDLPNDLAYAETCAAIGLVFWAQRMLQFEGDGRYADVLERALYNGVLSGVSLDGKRFFYANPLEVDPQAYLCRPDLYRPQAMAPTRQEWFGCACCPPNLARLLASLGGYVYSQGKGELYVHLYVGGSAEIPLDGQVVHLSQETRYPWEGSVRIALRLPSEMRFTLALRIPSWAEKANLWVNGQVVELEPLVQRGYARVKRLWQDGDVVELDLPMPVMRMEAHPAVRDDCGRVALQRGPLVYCFEEVDNGPYLADLALSREATLRSRYMEDLLGGVVVIEGTARRRVLTGWEHQLYRPAWSQMREVPFLAIPYYAWANRDVGEMLVWIREV
ncbi:MAG: glycoside hydrolase family 127 protein [Anaerolineae bacterium]|nr:glycoside hydrolase family 127 protein [Anaerolineae bacterium]